MAPTNIPSKTITIHVGPSLSDPSTLTEFRQSAAKDASNWNSLLRWHRRNRGPQWDYSTAMYHVDQGSPEYYAGVTPYEEPSMEEDQPKSSPERPQTGRRSASQSQRASSQQPQLNRRSSNPSSVPSATPNANTSSLPPMPLPESQASSLPSMPTPQQQPSQQPQAQQQPMSPQSYQQYQQQNQMSQSVNPGMLQKSP
ncbi:hypothetical protein P389DRAFT_212949 [Cystobasidium minutum MCA 4210]|uniref:uncharacterized protein n=1 Tax=Cystobasidium minutum MCA 4210 TaxID=1397322 RepID=UPI0034CD3D8A|eukprot:jgi/Rhomi1/212949/estExt_Genemark1.C_80169